MGVVRDVSVPRLLLGAAGVVLVLVGFWHLLGTDLSDLPGVVLWLAGGVVAHDAVIASLVVVVGVLAVPRLPVWSRAAVVAGLVVLLSVTLAAVPVLGRFGAKADDPGLLNRPYLLLWLLFAALVLVAVGVRGAGAPATVRHDGLMARVLVVDDDHTVREVVVSYLRAGGHDVDEAVDGEQALRSMRDKPADLVVLDLMLPGIDGLEVCRRLREQGDVPVIMLTALGGETDRVVGLEQGADDYVTKPFSPRELVLRVDSVLRRAGERASAVPETVADGDLVVDSARHVATLAGRELALTAREFDLLRFLVARPGVAYSRDQLLAEVWGWSFGDQSTVTVHVRRLREKVEQDPTHPARLVTVWGVGYRWEPAA